MKEIFKGESNFNREINSFISEPQIGAHLSSQMGLRSFGVYLWSMVWEFREQLEIADLENGGVSVTAHDGSIFSLKPLSISKAGQWTKVSAHIDDGQYQKDICLNGVPLSTPENELIEAFTAWSYDHLDDDGLRWDNAIDAACCQVSCVNGQPSWGSTPSL